MNKWTRIKGIVQPGYRVASGMTDHSPYPKGTIELQTPIFQKLGLDLTPFFPGTLNVSISPNTFRMRSPEYAFRTVHWMEGFPPEDFSFSPCRVIYKQKHHDGLIYYPHPESKIGHFQDPSVMEVIASLIPNLGYGDAIELEVNLSQVVITQQ